MDKIKLLIVDDHQMVRLGLSSFMSIQPDIEVVGEAADGESGYLKNETLKPDVILMDLVMDRLDGIEATKKILAQHPEQKILILTSFIDDEKVFPALEAGAKGYILKTSQASEIATAIRKVASGEEILSEAVKQKIYESKHRKHELYDDLSKRELEVLQVLATGLSNQEIADQLFISLKTVKTHVSNIFTKLSVNDRTQATIYAIEHKLVNK
ncbi:response regulator transcription factor [Lactococcus termiticola]|uniref:Two-component system response regulator n=1 Tax=Lactococcus termiticola TaxID=2169526 RepID=A0A2R5HG62_9LACT|nr:response regulator transcription factor [Lactococcus termiticola]GBG96315.1 two-component system response regulator [Lactococcus termiticola]